jgi:hypothetical protein
MLPGPSRLRVAESLVRQWYEPFPSIVDLLMAVKYGMTLNVIIK